MRYVKFTFGNEMIDEDEVDCSVFPDSATNYDIEREFLHALSEYTTDSIGFGDIEEEDEESYCESCEDNSDWEEITEEEYRKWIQEG